MSPKLDTTRIRRAVIDLTQSGWKPREIAGALPVHPSTVYRIIAEFDDLAELAGSLGVGRDRRPVPGEN